MIKYIAFNTSLNHLLFDNGMIQYEDECRKYPGAGWLYEVTQWCKTNAIALIPPDYFEHNPKEVVLIQEAVQCPDIFNKAREMGYNIIQFNLESPLYNPYFWDLGPHKTFMGLCWGKKPEFPAYRSKDFLPVNPKAKGTCAVLSNKWSALAANPDLIRTSLSYRRALAFESQTSRIRKIQQLSFPDAVTIAGQGYAGPDPFQLQAFLGQEVLPVGDKIRFMNRFERCVAWENFQDPSYVTEKIWDAISAGCKPIMQRHQAAQVGPVCTAQTMDSVQHWLREQEDTHPFSERAWVTKMIGHLESF